MHRLFILSMIFLNIHAADVGSPDVFMLRLKEIEKTRNQLSDSEIIFTYEKNDDDDFSRAQLGYASNYYLSSIKKAMQGLHAEKYLYYLVAVASSKKLKDCEKLKSELAFLSPFEHLTEGQVNQSFNHFDCNAFGGIDYPVTRLLLAGLLHSKVNLQDCSTKIVSEVLSLGDYSLLKMVLSKKFSLSDDLFFQCGTVQGAKLLVESGLDPAKAHRKDEDLISYICKNACYERANKILCFYFDYVSPDKSNKFGLKWMQAVAAVDSCPTAEDNIRKCTEMLLERGCDYNKEIKEKICKKVGKRSPESKKQIEQLFEHYKDQGKDIKGD